MDLLDAEDRKALMQAGIKEANKVQPSFLETGPGKWELCGLEAGTRSGPLSRGASMVCHAFASVCPSPFGILKMLCLLRLWPVHIFGLWVQSPTHHHLWVLMEVWLRKTYLKFPRG